MHNKISELSSRQTVAANSDTQLTKSSRLHKNLKRSAKFSAGVSGFGFVSPSSACSPSVCQWECVCVLRSRRRSRSQALGRAKGSRKATTTTTTTTATATKTTSRRLLLFRIVCSGGCCRVCCHEQHESALWRWFLRQFSKAQICAFRRCLLVGLFFYLRLCLLPLWPYLKTHMQLIEQTMAWQFCQISSSREPTADCRCGLLPIYGCDTGGGSPCSGLCAQLASV